MISHRVILICVLAFHFLVLIKGQPNVGYSQCDDIRQGFFNHYYCTLQCFGEVLHLSYIRGDLCEGTIQLSSNTKEPVPLPVVVQVIECITVRCKSAVPPSVCGGSNGFINESGVSQKSQPNPIDGQSDIHPYADNYPKEENNNNKDLKEGKNTEQELVKDTATAESVANANADKKSNNYDYGVDFYYDASYYDDDFYYDNDKDGHSDNGKKITDEKQLSSVDSKKKSDEFMAIEKDAKYKKSDDSGHDNVGHSERDDSDQNHNDNDDLKTESKKEVKSDKNLDIITDVKNSYTGENVKQEDKKESSKQKSVVATSNQKLKKEENAIKKSEQDSTKKEGVIKKSDEDSKPEKDVEKSTKQENVVEKPKEDATKEGNVKKFNEELAREENIAKKSNEDSTKEESIAQKLDHDLAKKENIDEKSKEDSTKEENFVKKSNKASIKEENVSEKSSEDPAKEKNIDKKSNANSLNEENVEKSNEDSIKEENFVQKSDQDPTKKERIIEESNEDSTKQDNIVAKSDQDSTRAENADKKANDYSKKDESVLEKSNEYPLKSISDSWGQKNKEIYSQNIPDENTKDLSSEIPEGSSLREAPDSPLEVENSKEKSSLSLHDDDYYFSSVPILKNDVNSDSNGNANADNQSNSKNHYSHYGTDTDKNSHQPNINSNYQPAAYIEPKTFDKKDKYKGHSSGNTDFANSESGLGSKTNEVLAPNIHNQNNYQFLNNQDNYQIPNNAINPNYPNNNAQITFQPVVPNKQQNLLGQNPQYFNMPQHTYAESQANAQDGPQNHPLNPSVYQNQFVPYPYGNRDYNIRGQPGNQYSKSFGIPNQGNNWNSQSQNSRLAQNAPNRFWNPHFQTQNQQVLPPNNAQFMNYGPSNLPVQHNVINTRVPSSQVYGQLPPWNAQPASAVISQSTSWNGNMPSRYQAPPWSGPVNSPPAVKNTVGMQTYQG